MDRDPPGVVSLVTVPAIITLAITVLRTIGEVNGWSPLLFGAAEAGGGGAILGISWLIFVFGLWFGVRVQRSGGGVARPGRTLLLALVPLALLFGGIELCKALELVWFPSAEEPGEPRGTVYFAALLLLGAVIAIAIWPRVGIALLVYAVLARVPVLAVTWLGVERHWDTHYVKLAPGFPAPAEGELFNHLAVPQITFWPAITIMLGTAMAALGALLVRGPKKT